MSELGSVTNELRRLLDERGVEWTDSGFPTTATEWCANGVVWHGLLRDGTIELVAMLTPEQAIEATLGPRITGETSDGYHTFNTPDQAIERIATLASRRRKTYTKEYCDCCDGAVLPKWDKCPWCGAPLVVDE